MKQNDKALSGVRVVDLTQYEAGRKEGVVVSNFMVGTMQRLGIDYPVLQAINPKIIYAAISGFGSKGPYHAYPCFDIIAQATGGGIEYNGFPDNRPHQC